MTAESERRIHQALEVVDWIILLLSPMMVAIAWDLGWISFEWAVIWILLALYYLRGELDEK